LAEGTGKELNTKATVAGGGVGTLLVVLAGQLAPNNQSLATILTYAAPAVSVGAAAAWVFGAAWAAQWRRRLVIDGALKRAIAFRDRVCSDPGASAEHKSAVREKVEHFERLAIAVIQTEFDSVDAKLEP
jgi:hypothetical protein